MNENLNKNKKENKEVKKDCITCKYWPYPYYGSPCLECSDCEDEAYKYWEPEEKIKKYDDDDDENPMSGNTISPPILGGFL